MASPHASSPDFADVYRAHHAFVWRTVRRLGVDPNRTDDAVQDVFLVVHRRLAEFAGRAAMRTWLFEIARRVASTYRRSAAREAPKASLDAHELTTSLPPPDEQAEAAALVERFLSELDGDQAVVFVLSELEEWRASEIADELGIKLNTVYSRLRAARRELDRLARRFHARDRRRSGAEWLACLAALDLPPPPTAVEISYIQKNMYQSTCLQKHAIIPAAGGHVGGLAIAGLGLVVLLVFGLRAPSAPAPAAPAQEPPAVVDAPAPVVLAPPPPAPSAVKTPAPVVLASPPAPVVLAPLPPAATTPAPRPPDREDELTAELALVESIRAAAQAGDSRLVLDQVARHRRRFPSGVFAQEAAAAAIEARCRLGEGDDARRAAAAFLARWPASPLAARVDQLCRS